MEVLARPQDREPKMRDQLIENSSLRERWEEAAGQVGQGLLASRHIFEDTSAHT